MVFRLNQRVCRISWKDGVPFVKFGNVTKVSKSAYYVDAAKTKSHGWFATVEDAFKFGYKSLFFDWDFLIGYKRREPDWTVEDTVRCVCELRRLQKRLMRRIK